MEEKKEETYTKEQIDSAMRSAYEMVMKDISAAGERTNSMIQSIGLPGNTANATAMIKLIATTFGASMNGYTIKLLEDPEHLRKEDVLRNLNKK